MSRLDLRGVWLALLLASPALAHGDHEAPPGVAVTDDPIVRLRSRSVRCLLASY